jgi:hypothetical protein
MFFDPALLPDIAPGERAEYNQLQDDEFFMLMDIIMSATEREEFYRDYDFNIRPATDNVPYFSQYLKLERYNKLREMFGQSAVPFLEIGYLIVLMTFIQIALQPSYLFYCRWLSSGGKAGVSCTRCFISAVSGWGLCLWK